MLKYVYTKRNLIDVGSNEKVTLGEKSPYSKLFWSVFSCIWTEYQRYFFKTSLVRENNLRSNINTAIQSVLNQFSCWIQRRHRGIIFPTKGAEVTIKSLLAKSYQY